MKSIQDLTFSQDDLGNIKDDHDNNKKEKLKINTAKRDEKSSRNPSLRTGKFNTGPRASPEVS